MKPVRPTPWARATATLGLLLAAVLVGGPRCAKSQCGINSDCGSMHYCDDNQLCRQDCREDRDCPGGYCNINGQCVTGTRPDAGPVDVPASMPDADSDATPPVDTAVDGGSPPDDVPVPPMDLGPTDTGVDVPPPPMDIPVDVPPPPVDIPPPPVDIPPPPVDVPVDVPVDIPLTGHGIYLDPCVVNSDCTSNTCALGPGGSRFCTRACTATSQCGLGYQCAAGRCLPDDTGTPCHTTASTCHQYCFGTASNSVCTHDCNNALDCPAGHACSGTAAGGAGGPFVCMPIEIPAGTSNCPSLLALPGVGCTARCRTVMDCPRLWPDFPSGYSCSPSGTFNVCVPPAVLVTGSDPMGSTCPATGAVQCRSGACDTSSTPPVCIEVCSLTGGCPAGWGCKPEPDTGTRLDMVCRPAGSQPLGASCTRGGECATALCQGVAGSPTLGYCTRLCNDGYCPTGMTCTPTGGNTPDGTPVSLCVRP